MRFRSSLPACCCRRPRGRGRLRARIHAPGCCASLSLLRTPAGGAAGERPERTARVVAATVRYRCATMTVAQDAPLRALFDRVAAASRGQADPAAVGAAPPPPAGGTEDPGR